ncbi:MAG TPA: helix-turn-helix transcriptional regulator [Streptosporangiaceae bacterium]|nr:helix-turn-helix transcriptional regulator [Streptosporangiaceae bacterium]
MSPVFRHGGLRLYLLKLLDEAPRHGYDVIRLLQDKFLGVYSPSPGTIYPRLARLEEEGLVTHETVEGKKVYRITDAGRAELNRRMDDLADLEDELAASVRDIAREISRDVRETVRNLRDELTWAVREAGRTGRPGGHAPGPESESWPAPRPGAPDAAARAPDGAPPAEDRPPAQDRPPAEDRQPGGDSRAAEGAQADADPRASAWQQATADADDGPGAEAPASDATPADAAGEGAGAGPGPGGNRQSRGGPGDRRERTEWTERADWREFAEWAKRQDWGEWVGKHDWQEWKERARTAGRADWAGPGRSDWLTGGRPRDRRDAGPDLMANLENLAAAFAREIRGAARQAENVSDDALGNLGRILSDTLNRIRSEVFREPGQDADHPEPPGASE